MHHYSDVKAKYQSQGDALGKKHPSKKEQEAIASVFTLLSQNFKDMAAQVENGPATLSSADVAAFLRADAAHMDEQLAEMAKKK